MAEQANDMRRLLNFFSLSNNEMDITSRASSAPAAKKQSSPVRSAPKGNNFVDPSDEWEEF